MLTNLAHARVISVPDYGQIGAGQTVEFLPSVRRRKIVRPATARPYDDLISIRVAGDSLRDDGIFDGDRVTCRRNFEMSEVKNGRLVVARIPEGGLVIKHFYLFDSGCEPRVLLRSANSNYEDLDYELGEVEIKAIVIESVRSWD
jgi:SOS-response transcriptional repressor LexA